MAISRVVDSKALRSFSTSFVVVLWMAINWLSRDIAGPGRASSLPALTLTTGVEGVLSAAAIDADTGDVSSVSAGSNCSSVPSSTAGVGAGPLS